MSDPAPTPAAPPSPKKSSFMTVLERLAQNEAAKLEANGWNFVKLHAVVAITFVLGVIVGALLF